MTLLSATTATLPAVLRSATHGDAIALEPGAYGDVSLRAREFDPPLKICAAQPSRAPGLRSLLLKEVRGVELVGLDLAFTPDQATIDSTSVVMIDKSSRITMRGGSIHSGLAVNGVREDAKTLDKTGNVIGRPTCRGVTVQNSDDVLLEGIEIRQTARGVVVGGGRRVTVRGNHIHHLRKTGILGGCDDLLVEGNHLHSNKPWNLGTLGAVGDHADFIAIWNGGATPMRNIDILRNRMETGEGMPMMGVWVQGKTGKILGVRFIGNIIVGGDHQGFVVSDVEDALIRDNAMIQDLPVGKPFDLVLKDGTKTRVDPKPIGIIAGNRSARVNVTANVVGSVSDKQNGATGSTVDGNHIVQTTDAAKPGFLALALDGKPAGLARVFSALRKIYPALPPFEMEPAADQPRPARDVLRESLAVRADAKLEPLKTKGRLIVNFRTPAEAQAALRELRSVPMV